MTGRVNNLFSFERMVQLRPGGTADTLATLGMAMPFIASNPIFPAGVLEASFLTAAAGAAWWTKRFLDTTTPSTIESNLQISSAPLPFVGTQDGFILGYCVDTGQPLIAPVEDWTRHAFIIGQSGVGKTVFMEWINFQQILKGGGLLFIDGKIDADNLKKLTAMCAYAGRLDDLYVIDTGNPDLSNTYNPVLYGDPDEIASRLVSMIPGTENNAGADYYRNETTYGLMSLISAIQAAGMACHPMDIAVCLQSPRALKWLLSCIPEDRPERKQFELFLDKYRAPGKDGQPGDIDVRRLKETFGGMGGRLALLGNGNFGRISNHYTPDVVLYDAIINNKIIYVALETMGKQETAMMFAKLLVGDIRSALAKVQRLPPASRPNPPFLVGMDEAGSYMTMALGRIFEQARSARITMMPSVQTMANLDAISKELTEFIIGNTEINVFFRIGSQDSAEKVAELIGMELKKKYRISYSDNSSRTDVDGVPGAPKATSSSDSFSFTEELSEEYRISPDMLKSLAKGEAIVLYGKHKIYHIKVPTFSFDPAVTPNFTINRPPPRPARRGLNLHKREMQEKLLSPEWE